MGNKNDREFPPQFFEQAKYFAALFDTKTSRRFVHDDQFRFMPDEDTSADGDIEVGVEDQIWEVFRLPDEVTASGFLSRVGNDIVLQNLTDGHLIIGNASNVATSVDTAAVGDIDADTVAGLTIKANAVTEAKINNGAVTTDKLGTDAVTIDKIANDAVGADQLADNAVDTNAIQDGAITAAKIASGAIGSLFMQANNGNAGTINAGALVRIKSDGNFDLAQADSLANSEGVVGVLLANTATGVQGDIQVGGIATVTTASQTIAGLGNLTPGKDAFLSKATAGSVTDANTGTEEVTTGNTIVRVGRAISATQMRIALGDVIELEN